MNFEEYVNNLKRKIKTNTRENLYVCIGNTDILWDSIGPLVGSYLKNRIGEDKVLGDVKHNICSKWDLTYYYPIIKNKFVIAIDSAISSKELLGQIFVSETPIIMGLALNLNKGKIGDVSIKASVADLKGINANYVDYMARFISDGICEVNYSHR